VAERIKYHSFIVFSFIMAVAIYPIVGHWIWGGGVLAPGKDNWFGENAGFFDFAGSTVVHSVGGWAALAGIIVLGPRLGKYGPDGRINAIPGHNLTAATIGCFVLWFGWFGFNPGSTMAVDFNAIGRIAITTNTAAAGATITATITAWILMGKPDLGMTLNGCLAGLVAITAPCMFVTVQSALIIGLVAGVLVVLAVMMFDRLKIDDPVGATSVHLVNGVFGTICVGLFGVTELEQSGAMVATGLKNNGLLTGGGTTQLIPQLVGVGLVAVYVFVVALIAWMVLKFTIGIRVSPEEELEGLDIGEHGNEAYHGFVMAAEPVYSSSEPRAATVPPDSKRFSVVVEGVENGDLMHAWSELCQPAGKGGPTPDFKAVYPHVTTVQGNRFRCRGGEPEVVRGSLEKLLQTRMQAKGIRVRVDK
jgi:Amt family ammonium transporter